MNTNDDDRIIRLADEIRVWNAVAVVGAGISAASGLPLAGQLSPLLWHAYDSDPAALAELMITMASQAPTAKQIIGDDEQARSVGLRILPSHETARLRFQTAFAALDAARNASSPTHDSLAVLLHHGFVELIVSLNWDTQLEKAYERQYGRRVAPDGPELHKPHGDAASPNDRWTYPGERSRMSDGLSQQLSALADERPRLLVIIGYSEADEVIVQRLIKPYERRWRVVRIGPHATGADDIPLRAESALPRILSRLAPLQVPTGWGYVRFSQQADLGLAFLGHSLGASHVRVCPRLPEVDVISQQLSTTGRVTLVGSPGSGKSITAYQAAYSLSKRGWEILKLSDPTVKQEELLQGISDLRNRTVLLIDDAQLLTAALRSRVNEFASPKIAVLTVITGDASEYANSVTIAGSQAVQVLASTLLTRRRETLTIVRKLDDQVGDRYLDVRLEDRIADARKAETPWQFSFILTGGWRRTRQELAVIRDRHRADLLLLGLASIQLGSLGSSVERAWLPRVAKILGRDEAWLEPSIEVLCRRRLLMSENDLRCPHLRFSSVVIRVCCGLPRDPEWPSITAMLQLVLCEKGLPLRGLRWLLHELRFADGFGRLRGELIDKPTWRVLVDRCWTASAEDRGDACSLLEVLILWRPKHLDELEGHTNLLQQWFENADARWCYGASRLLNSIHNSAKDFGVRLCAGIRSNLLAQKLSQSSVEEGYVWGQFLDRVGVAAGETWRRSLAQNLKLDTLESLHNVVDTDDDLWSITQLDLGVSSISIDVAVRMVSLLESRIAARINRSPAEAYGEFGDVFWRVLGYGPDFLRVRKPKPKQRRVARAVIRQIDKKLVAQAISRARLWELEPLAHLAELILEVEPRSAGTLVAELDLTQLDQEIGREWGQPPHELQVMLSTLALGEDREPARSWITRHADELQTLTPHLACIAPDVAAAAIRRGVALPLGLSHGLGWLPAAAALEALGQVDHKLVGEVVAANRNEISQGLQLPQANSCEHLTVFCEVLEGSMPGELESMLTKLDAAAVERDWQARLRGKSAERKAARLLVSAAARGSGHVASVAQRLLARRRTRESSKQGGV